MPEYIPCQPAISWPVWNTYRERLEDLALKYPLIWPGFVQGNMRFAGSVGLIRSSRVNMDRFGCAWRYAFEGDYGIVVKNPLESWDSMKDLTIPDPEDGLPEDKDRDLVSWDKVYENLRRAREMGNLVSAGVEYSLLFERLSYLRGYNNLLVDFIRRPPQLYELVERLGEYYAEVTKRLLRFSGLDVIFFGDDLGTQDRIPMRRSVFHEFLFPIYRKIFSRIRNAGVHVHMESDGHMIEFADDLIEAGVSILRMQDVVNGVENMAAKYKGRICIDVDIDRQFIIPFGTPEQVRAHVRSIVQALGSKEGGLMLATHIFPPVTMENIEALVQAMDGCMWYYGS